jgi:hypothetical protein
VPPLRALAIDALMERRRPRLLGERVAAGAVAADRLDKVVAGLAESPKSGIRPESSTDVRCSMSPPPEFPNGGRGHRG